MIEGPLTVCHFVALLTLDLSSPPARKSLDREELPGD